MRAYSQDLRERVIQALESRDGSQAEIAERFGVSIAFVERLWQRWRTTGSCAALPHAEFAYVTRQRHAGLQRLDEMHGLRYTGSLQL